MRRVPGPGGTRSGVLPGGWWYYDLEGLRARRPKQGTSSLGRPLSRILRRLVIICNSVTRVRGETTVYTTVVDTGEKKTRPREPATGLLRERTSLRRLTLRVCVCVERVAPTALCTRSREKRRSDPARQRAARSAAKRAVGLMRETPPAPAARKGARRAALCAR
ncbi:hypothetical protein MRX96_004433 [Rhipicephalus microplus]